MRLIDADKLIDYFYFGIDDKPIIDGISDRKIIDIIKNQPTAYDIDKVVKELGTMSQLITIKDMFKVYENVKMVATDTAIEIVKQGGVSDDVCEWKGKEKEYIQNPHTKRLYSNEESMKNCYCNTCGKKIKVVE